MEINTIIFNIIKYIFSFLFQKDKDLEDLELMLGCSSNATEKICTLKIKQKRGDLRIKITKFNSLQWELKSEKNKILTSTPHPSMYLTAIEIKSKNKDLEDFSGTFLEIEKRTSSNKKNKALLIGGENRFFKELNPFKIFCFYYFPIFYKIIAYKV